MKKIKQIFVINGLPRSGKDTFVNEFNCIYNQCMRNNTSYVNGPSSFNTTENSELSGGQYNITVSDYEVYSVEF